MSLLSRRVTWSPGTQSRRHHREDPTLQNGEQSAFQKAGINCPGDRPWLGEGAAEPDCRQPLIGALINQTNIYFPRTLSAIALPDLQMQDEAVNRLRTEIEKDAGNLGIAKTIWNMGNRAGTVALIQIALRRSRHNELPMRRLRLHWKVSSPRLAGNDTGRGSSARRSRIRISRIPPRRIQHHPQRGQRSGACPRSERPSGGRP